MYKITNIPDKPAIYYEDKGCQIYFSKQLLLYNRVFFLDNKEPNVLHSVIILQMQVA